MQPSVEAILRRPAPAYLLAGSEGDSLAAEARGLVQFFLCRTRSRCGDCLPCQKFLSGTHPDVMTLTPERGSIKIDEVRRLTDRVRFKPLEAEEVFLILFDADRMTEAAANALLKTLEEPPSYAHFLLTSQAPERLPATVRSRCQRIRTQTALEVDREKWAPLLSFWREKILPRFIATGTPRFATASALAAEVAAMEDVKEFLSFLKIWWRDLLVYQETGDPQYLLLAKPDELSPPMPRDGERLGSQFRQIVETERALEGNVLKQLAFERLFLGLMT